MDSEDEAAGDLTEEQAADLAAIRARKRVLVGEHRSKKNSHRNQVGRRDGGVVNTSPN